MKKVILLFSIFMLFLLFVWQGSVPVCSAEYLVTFKVKSSSSLRLLSPERWIEFMCHRSSVPWLEQKAFWTIEELKCFVLENAENIDEIKSVRYCEPILSERTRIAMERSGISAKFKIWPYYSIRFVPTRRWSKEYTDYVDGRMKRDDWLTFTCGTIQEAYDRLKRDDNILRMTEVLWFREMGVYSLLPLPGRPGIAKKNG